jgi:putative transcriptional regulator
MHHYITCGLQNVWLSNGYRYGESPYGPTLAIADTPGLTRSIATAVAMKDWPLSRQEIRFLHKHLELSYGDLEPVIGLSAQFIASIARCAPIVDGSTEHEKSLVFRYERKVWKQIA